MKIYTGITGGEKLKTVIEYGLGTMISPSPTRQPSAGLKETSCALDNGAFRCWQRGYPFMESHFLRCLNKCYEIGIDLDFIVCPDIVTGGLDSLDFSMEYSTTKLKTARNLALAVQDGMEDWQVAQHRFDNFTHIFVGGTVDWKWNTAETWVGFAHERGLKCHIGRCGTIDRLMYAESIGADSVDSTSFARNDSWHIIDELRNGKTLFKAEEEME